MPGASKNKTRFLLPAAVFLAAGWFFAGLPPPSERRGGSDGPGLAWAAPPAVRTYREFSSPKEERKYRKMLKERGRTDVRRWLYLFGALSAPAAAFLAYRAVSSGTRLPEEVDLFAAKLAVAILSAWLLLYLYYMTGFWLWLALAPWVGFAAAVSFVWPFARRFYRLKLGIASFPGGWICSECGIENDRIFLECLRCKNPKKN